MGKMENGRRAAAWKCPFPATLSKPFSKALPSIKSFFSNVNPVVLITQFLRKTEPTQQFSPRKVLHSAQVEKSPSVFPS